MTKDRFWEIIAESRAGFDPTDIEGSMDGQVRRLQELLSALSVEEVRAFGDRFDECMAESYSEPKVIVDMEPMDGLWAVAFSLGGGCGHDAFDDFRAWLISMGRKAYDAALRDPKTVYGLVKRLMKRAEDDDLEAGDIIFFEEFQYVPSRVLRQKSGEDD
jgi:hypothetical protein